MAKKSKGIHHSKKKRNLPAPLAVLPRNLPTAGQMEKGFGQLERVFEKRFSDMSALLESRMRQAEEKHKLHIHDGPQATKVVAELAGFSKKDISLHVTDHSLSVSAHNKGESFYRSFSLPFLVIPEKASANFKGGRLTVVLPKYKERVEGGRKLKL